MVRTVFIQRKVLELYRLMGTISYPIQPEEIISYLPQQCRIISENGRAEPMFHTGCCRPMQK